MKCFGTLAVVKSPEDVGKALKNRCTSIYLERSLNSPLRVMDAQPLIGHQKGFIVKEGPYLIACNVLSCFYNKAYETERQRLKTLLSEHGKTESIAILGSGSGVFSLHLAELADVVVNYDINPVAIGLSFINTRLNKKPNIVGFCRDYKQALIADYVIAVMPHEDLSTLLSLKYRKLLVLYLLMQKTHVFTHKDLVSQTQVKDYSRDRSVMRLVFENEYYKRP